MISYTNCISNINVSWITMHLMGRIVYGAMKKGSELTKEWEEDYKNSVSKALNRMFIGSIPVNPSRQPKTKNFRFITTNSMQDFFDFYFIFEPGFRLVKESIFDTIDFLNADEFIEDVNKQTKEYLLKEEIKKGEFVDKVISKFSSLVIEKLKCLLENKFFKAKQCDDNNSMILNDGYKVLAQEMNELCVKFKADNKEELAKAVEDNTKEAIVLNILEVIKSKFFLLDCGEIFIPKFYRLLYIKSKKDFYFKFFGKTKNECIAEEKEKNNVYKRLQSMKQELEYNDNLDNIFVPFSNEDASSQYIQIFSSFCSRTAEIRTCLEKGKSTHTLLFSTILSDELKMFQPVFLFSESILYFGIGFSEKIKSNFIDYAGIFNESQVVHISFIDLKPFLPEFLLNYSEQLIISENKYNLCEIIRKEYESISDNTKEIIKKTSSYGNIRVGFLHEIYKVYLKSKFFECKLNIYAFDISLDSFREIYSKFLKDLKGKTKIFLIDEEEMEKCRDFFLKCILFKIKSITDIFNHENLLSIEVTTIKE
ncbi:hypothetical protein CWI37_2220p0010 [Hamiltosporidium tvaerminnensis]|uniref:Uncharacterized protein n=2 Tax=Hamiltosporidium tvaerminnensis TaxID=1176355 RepID=A0A4Q9KRZ0_9MICR|nr:hypothetical protein CWI37_2220p0010 [Hamiltosporidium tvaerminnensis]